MKKWIEYVVAMDPEAEIALHGISMGGGHGNSYLYDPEGYFDKAEGFVSKFVK